MNSTQIIALFFCVSIIVLVFFDVIKREKVEKINFFSKEQTDWLRGIAILLVMHSHYFADENLYVFSGVPRQLLSSIGFLGVGLFVFMSGYATMISYNTKPDYLKYYIPKRLLRLYIPFLIAYVVFVIIMLFYGKQLSLNDFLGLPIMSLPRTLNWYLKVQLGLYIAFYLVAKIFKKSRTIIFALFLVCAVFMIVGNITKISNFWFESSYLFPLGMLFAFYRDGIFDVLSKRKMFSFFLSSFVLFITYILYYFLGGLFCEIIFTFGFVQFLTTLCIYFKGESNVLKFLGVLSIDLYLSHIVYSNTIMIYYNVGGSIISYVLFIVCSMGIGLVIHNMSKLIIGAITRKTII